MIKPSGLRIGLFGIGLEAYWKQFPGLEDRLKDYVGRASGRLEQFGATVVNLGLIDTPQRALDAGHRFRQADVDVIFLYVTTYALSSTVLPVVRRAKVPVIVLSLSPGAAIDYPAFNRLADRTQMTGEWLAWCQVCPVPEIANVFARARIPFFQVTGMLGNDPVAWQEIEDWVAAARVAHVMEHNRLGLLGHCYPGMLDIYSDVTRHCSTFGGHVEILEMDELSELRRSVTTAEIAGERDGFAEQFDIQADCPAEELDRAARTSAALRRFVDRHQLGSIAYYYRGTPDSPNEDTVSSLILGASLMTAGGVPMAGEYEVKNAQAMKIMDAFGAGGSFTEYYATDYNDDIILMGHDGPGHPAIAEGKTKVRPLTVFHGKAGRGLSVEMSVRHGPVTLLSVVDTADGRLELLFAEAESVPGPILEIGNTNSRYHFSMGARRFIGEWNNHGPAHHCAIGVGHIGDRIAKLAALLGIAAHRVC
jgi:L-arabinose isomerase